MNTKSTTIFHIVKTHINKWDPYDLLPFAPLDEYDSESKQISKKITKQSTVYNIAIIISKVFTSSFGDTFTSDKCLTVAQDINDEYN